MRLCCVYVGLLIKLDALTNDRMSTKIILVLGLRFA